MDLVQRLSAIKPDQETVLTIGVFDGVHLGHCHLLDEVINKAGNDYIPAVMTFTNHFDAPVNFNSLMTSFSNAFNSLLCEIFR